MVRHRYASVKMREVFPSPISPPNWGDPTTPSPALYQADKSLRDALGPPPSSRSFSSAVDKPYVDNGVSSTGPMLITASRKTQSPSSAGKNSAPYSPWWLRNASISAGT
jgi:hypothetical protein